jgi:DNA-binding transcriptional regulator YhcF (GntR family)
VSEFGPAPSNEALETERRQWRETRDTRERIEEVVVGIHELTSVAKIAESAHCSANAARKHLAHLADLGVVRRATGEGMTRYVRNDEYFRWRRANELTTENDAKDLLAELERLEVSDERFRERYGVPTPGKVEFPDDADHGEIHDRWTDTGEWETVRREIALHKEAIRMIRRRADTLV